MQLLPHLFQLGHHHPGQEGFRAPLPLAVLGQVDGHHLPALGVGDLGEPLPLLLVAGLAVEEEADLVAFLAITYVRGMAPQSSLFQFKLLLSREKKQI